MLEFQYFFNSQDLKKNLYEKNKAQGKVHKLKAGICSRIDSIKQPYVQCTYDSRAFLLFEMQFRFCHVVLHDKSRKAIGRGQWVANPKP